VLGERVYLRGHRAVEAPSLLDLRLRNREFLEPFEPVRPDSFFTLDSQHAQILGAEQAWRHDEAYAFGIFDKATDAVVGRVALSNVVRASWNNATIGYFVDHEYNGRGVATEAVGLAVKFAFEQAGLHRVQAGVMPHNSASLRVLEKVGFRYEGLAERYLRINGVWEDHRIYAITTEDWERLNDPDG
jgi:ribosomal-protein-alanine N-acetyltransferase